MTQTQTQASYHRVPDEAPARPSGCRIPSLRLVEGQSLERFPNITFRGPRELLVAWDA